jgi:protein-S-isoprenylcysteine O-methyltransferase Ste14
MTTNLFAFNTVATIYLVVGSVHEEMQLRRAFGRDYERYAESGIDFYLPFPRSGTTSVSRCPAEP